MHLFDPFLDHDYYFKLLLNKEEQDAQSITRCSGTHHRDFRAVLRANRTLSSAHSPIPGASSRTNESPVSWPRRLWRSFVPVASPGESTGSAIAEYFAPPPGPPPPAR